MPKKKNSLSVFDKAFQESGLGNPEINENITDLSNAIIDNTNIDIDDLNKIEEPVENTEGQKETDLAKEDNTEIPNEVLNRMNDTSKEDVGEQGEDIDDSQYDENEATNVGAFFDAFADALNWDVSEDDKPDSIEGLIDYIGDVVEQNSKPKYSDERIQQLDEYVRNGGKFEDLYSNMSKSVSFEDMNIEDESNQKAVIREYLKTFGYSDEQIKRKIDRYEDADVLIEEAEDAVSRLKEIKQKELEEQQAQQELIMQQQQEQAIQFAKSLNDSIVNLDNIRGFSVPREDRKKLYDYITKTDENGLTQYQKDFNKNVVSNLIESAYFTMKGDSLLNEAKKTGQTSAANKLRKMLRHQSKNHSTYNVQEEKQRSVADIASKWL